MCPFPIKLDRFLESCNSLNDLSNKVCAPKKPRRFQHDLDIFNKITGINELKTSTKHISWKWKCKFDSRKRNSNQKWNNVSTTE